jgi:cation transport ATPase
VLVIATPCPLLLAIPVAIIGAVSLAASRAIIVKNPSMLERIDTCTTVVFDKTGTLTYGKPVLSETVCAAGTEALGALRLAASLERYSKHPLAKAVMDAAESAQLDLASVSEIHEKPGQGLSGRIGDDFIQICGRKQIAERPDVLSVLPPVIAGMECILLVNGTYSATLRFHDAPRRESRVFVHHLGPKHNVNRILLLSGDREAEVRYLAGEVGISEVLFGRSPEEKLEIVRQLATLFLGDGVNDAPAMQAATVGIAFGHDSDVTAEAADAVVLEPSLSKVDELIHIGRRMRRIALQSAVGGMALSILGMGLAVFGYLPPVAGAIAQEIIDALAVLNALRVAFPSEDLRDEGI